MSAPLPPWGTDTPISMPEPLRRGTDALVDFGGFAFSEGGMVHNFSEADLQAYSTPVFLPTYPAEGA